MPPHLLSNLLKALNNLSPNIQKIGIFILAAWPTHFLKTAFVHACDVTLGQFKPCPQRPKIADLAILAKI